MTKQNIIDRLQMVDTKPLDDTLKGIISYTLGLYEKNPRNVTMADLKFVLKDLEEAKVELPTIENLSPVAEVKTEEKPKVAKKVIKKPAKKVVKKTEEPEVEEPKTEEKPKTKETEVAKKVAKKPVEKVEPLPETIKLGEKTIKKVGVLKDFAESEETLYTVERISKENLHDVETYNDLGFVPKKLKNLPDDLDVVNLVWNTPKVAYGVSVYTEVFYTFLDVKKVPVYVEI